MTCPKCKKQNDSCAKYFIDLRKMYRRRKAKWMPDGETVKCGYCRGVSHADNWSDEWGQPELNESN